MYPNMGCYQTPLLERLRGYLNLRQLRDDMKNEHCYICLRTYLCLLDPSLLIVSGSKIGRNLVYELGL